MDPLDFLDGREFLGILDLPVYLVSPEQMVRTVLIEPQDIHDSTEYLDSLE